MRFITQIVRRAILPSTRAGLIEPQKTSVKTPVRGKSPRARLRAEALSFLA